VTAIDQHSELNRSRAAQVADGVERRPDRPPGEEDVVDQDDHGVGDATGRLDGLRKRADPAHAKVVAVERGVQRPDRDVRPIESPDTCRKSVCEGNSTGGDAEENDAMVGLCGPFDDLVRHPVDDATDVSRVEKW
jgi:hypothetical protein